MPEPTSKTCKRCGEEKPLTEFHKVYKELDYRRSDCKPCSLVKRREWLEAKKAAARAASEGTK